MIDQDIQKYEKMLEEDPRSRAFAPLAEAYRKTGNLEDAVRVAKAGLAIHPGYTGGLVVLGRALYEMKELDKAVEVLKKAVSDTPESYLGQKFLGKALMEKGENQEALIALEAANLQSPDDGEVVELLEKVRPKAQPPEAIVFSGTGEGEGSEDVRIVTYEQKPTTVDGVELEPLPLGVDEKAFTFSEIGEEELTTPEQVEGPPGTSEEEADTIDMLGPEAAAFIEEGEQIDDTTFRVPEEGLDQEEDFIDVEDLDVEDLDVEDLIEEISAEPEQVQGHPSTLETEAQKRVEQTPVSAPPAPSAMEEISSRFEAADTGVSSERAQSAPEPKVSPASLHLPPDNSASAGEISTQTLADLYAKQGLVEKAVEIYRQILLERPSDQEVMAKLEELEGRAENLPQPDIPEVSDTPDRDISPTDTDDILNVLENWLQNAERMERK